MSFHKNLMHPKYRADIDGLRAIAVISVVLFHAFPGFLPGGFIGVDIFFVISGYLITLIIIENIQKESFSFFDFYVRRAKRILPALLLVLAVTLFFGWFALLPHEYHQVGKHVIASAGFVQNFILWGEAGYFDNVAETKPLLHIWSLGVEEQFYLLWPFILWFFWSRGAGFLIPVLLVFIFSFYLNLDRINTDKVGTFYLPHTRFWELVSGGLLAWLKVHYEHGNVKVNSKAVQWFSHQLNLLVVFCSRRLVSNFLSLLGLVLIVYGLLIIDAQSAFPGVLALLPVLGAMLLIFSSSKAWFNKSILSNRVLVWFGLISYPLYLWHWPLISFLHILEEGVAELDLRLYSVLLAIILAAITYYFIERPIRSKSTNIRVLLGLGIINILIILGGIYVVVKDGLPNRVHVSEIAPIDSLFDRPYSPYASSPCSEYRIPFSNEFLKPIDGECLVLNNQQPTRMFVGDSHTIQFANSLVNANLQEGVLILKGNNCFPFSGENYMSKNECNSAFLSLIDFLENDKKIQTIYLSAFWSKSISGRLGDKGVNWRLAALPNEEDVLSFLGYGRTFLTAAQKNGRKVVFMRDIPILNFDIKRCFNLRPIRLGNEAELIRDCSLDWSEYSSKNKVFFEAVGVLLKEFPKVQVYDPKTFLCKKGSCQAVIDNKPVYFNGDHVNVYGGDLILNDMKSKGFLQ